MISRRHDWTRLVLLLPLLLLAAAGRSLLEVDVENLAMKSVGTQTDRLATMRAEAFGNEPNLLLMATPWAPEVRPGIDAREIGDWIESMRARPEVVALTDRPSPNPGEHFLGVTLRTDAEGRYAEAVKRLGAAAHATLPPTYRLAIAGVPAVEVAIATRMRAERERILPIIVATLGLVLFLVYRNPILVLGTLLAPLVGVFLLDGLQGLLGLSIDPVSALLGPAVLTVGVASGVHVIERYGAALRACGSVVEASVRAARELRLPLWLTLATTVSGFLGLLSSPIPAVRRFGLLASVGVVLVVLVTLLCVPSLLRLLHRPSAARPHQVPDTQVRYAMSLRRRALPVLALGLLLAGGGAYHLSDSRVDSDPLHVLPAGARVRRDAQRLARQLGGSEVFELLLPPGGPSTPLAPLKLVSDVLELEGVVGVADAPRTSADGHRLLSFFLAPGGSAMRVALFDEAESLAARSGWPNAGATGLAVRVARDSNALVNGQREGILATLFGLWIVMAIGFRSPWLGLLGLVPNVLPLVLIQGTLGALGQPLSVATSMIGSVMLGLIVDDTIHLLHAYRLAAGGALRRMARALAAVRRPITITTAVLAVGFAGTLLGELDATREFGVLAVATLGLAFLADLVLLPALILWQGPRSFRLRRRAAPCLEHPSTTS